MLLEACPSFRARWTAYVAEPEYDESLLYVHLGEFAPLAPQSRLHGQSPLADLCNSSQVERIPEPARSMFLLGFAAFRSIVYAPVMQAVADADRLLTVKQAATRLRTSTATVYGLCHRGELTFMRISSNAIRIAERDLRAFVGAGLPRGTRMAPAPRP